MMSGSRYKSLKKCLTTNFLQLSNSNEMKIYKLINSQKGLISKLTISHFSNNFTKLNQF